MGPQVPRAGRAVIQFQAAVLSSWFSGGTYEGTSSLGTPTGSRVTLTMQPTQKPLLTTQQPKRKCNLKSISLYKQLILWDFSLQAYQLFEVNEAHIKGQPVTHQEIKPPLSGGKWLLQSQPPASYTQAFCTNGFIYPHLRHLIQPSLASPKP